jgi:hypothetical protein
MHEFFDKAELQSQPQIPSRQMDLDGHCPELMQGLSTPTFVLQLPSTLV